MRRVTCPDAQPEQCSPTGLGQAHAALATPAALHQRGAEGLFQHLQGLGDRRLGDM
jgi:hypothetical protein